MGTNSLLRFFAVFSGAAMIVMLGAGCEVRAPGPPTVVVGPPVVDVGPEIDIVGDDGYHHHGHYDDHHRWHGWYEDEHHQRHDDPDDWHHR